MWKIYSRKFQAAGKTHLVLQLCISDYGWLQKIRSDKSAPLRTDPINSLPELGQRHARHG